MGIITGYPDDDATTDDDKFLTSDASGATKLTLASRLKSYILAAGNVVTSALAAAAVTAAKIDFTTLYLGSASISSQFTTTNTTGTAPTAVTGLSVTFTPPTGVTKVAITVYTRALSNATAGTFAVMTLHNSSTLNNTTLVKDAATYAAATGTGSAITLYYEASVTAGTSYTFAVGLYGTGGTARVEASTPATISVKAIA